MRLTFFIGLFFGFVLTVAGQCPTNGITVPYFENFDTTDVDSIPDCWSLIAEGGSVVNAQYGTINYNNPFSAPKHFMIYTGGNAHVVLVTPLLQDLSQGDKQVVFQAKALGWASTGRLIIGSLGNPDSMSTFNAIDTVTVSNGDSTFSVDVGVSGGYNGTDSYIGLMPHPNDLVWYYLDDFNYLDAPTCQRPFKLRSRNIDANEVELYWKGGQGGTSNWVVEAVLSGSRVVYSSANDTAVITGLAANADYCFRVGQICSPQGDTAWSVKSHCVKTLCAIPTISLPYYEGFETVDTTLENSRITWCGSQGRWEIRASSLGRIRVGQDALLGLSGTGGITMDQGAANIASNTADLTLDMSAYQGDTGIYFSFDYMNHGGVGNNKDIVAVRGSKNDPWIELMNWDYVTGLLDMGKTQRVRYIDLAVELASHNQDFSKSFQLRFSELGSFQAVHKSGYSGVTFDNISLIKESCPSSVSNFTYESGDQSVTAQWQGGASVGYKVKLCNEDSVMTLQGPFFTPNPKFYFAGLVPETTYEVYIQDSCSAGTSRWKGPFIVTTKCQVSAVTLPFYEGFETFDTSATSVDKSFCLGNYRCDLMFDSTGSIAFGNGTGYSLSGNGSLVLTGGGPGQKNRAVFTWDMSGYIGDTNVFLSFDYLSAGGLNSPGDSIWVRGGSQDRWIGLYAWNDNISTGKEYSIEHINVSDALETAGQAFSSEFQLSIGYEGAWYVSFPVGGDGVAFDNLNLYQLDCSNEITDVMIGAGSTSCSLEWTGSASIGYNVEIVMKGDSLGSGTRYYTSQDSLYVTNLSADSLYDVYIQDSCTTGVGGWFGPFTFETLCAFGNTALPFKESFETLDTTIVGVKSKFCFADHQLEFIPTEVSGRARFGADAIVKLDGTGSLTMDYGSESSANFCVLSLNLAQYAGDTNLFLSFDYMNHGDEKHRGDSVWVRGSNTEDWIGVYDWNFTGVQMGTIYHVDSIRLSDYLFSNDQNFTESFQVRFGQQDNYNAAGAGGSDGLTVDNVSVNRWACSSDIDNVKREGMPDSIYVSWSGAAGVGYLVELVQAGAPAGSGTSYFTINQFLGLGGLPANSYYDIYITDSCASGKGRTKGPYSVSTSCNLSPTTLPFVEDFEGVDTNVVGREMNLCGGDHYWQLRPIDDNGRIRFGSSAVVSQSGMGAATLDMAGGFSSNRLILTLNLDNYIGDSAVYLSFDFANHNDEEHPGDWVLVRGSRNDPWLGLFDWNTSSSAKGVWNHVDSIDVSSILFGANQNFSSTFQIRFSQQDEGFYPATLMSGPDGVSFDNVVLAGKSCRMKPDSLQVVHSDCDSLFVEWRHGDTMGTASVEYGPHGFLKGSGIQRSVIGNQCGLGGLKSGTSYDLYIAAICSGDTTSWLGPVEVLTDSVPLPVPIIISNQLSAYTYQFDASSSLGVPDLYVWNFGDGSPADTGAVVNHTYSSGGADTVLLYVGNECGYADTSMYIEDIGIDRLPLTEFQIFPNPTDGLVEIRINSNEIFQVKVYDTQGRLVYTLERDPRAGETVLDFSGMAKGIYMILVSSSHQHHSQKIRVK